VLVAIIALLPETKSAHYGRGWSQPEAAMWPPFETAASRPPQGEAPFLVPSFNRPHPEEAA